MFYSVQKNTWFDPDSRAAYENTGSWPSDAAEYPREVFDAVVSNRPADKVMVPDESGRPVLVDPPPPAPLTVEQIEALRLAAYADPVTGSDRFFSEVSRMQAMGEAGWEALRDQGAARYEEIKAEYPWPS